jgi:chromosome segregation ATPase
VAEGAGIDRWEEGFDSWTPREADAERASLLRLARELGEKRRAFEDQTDPELVQLKQSLRQRAEAIAARERELAELQKRFEGRKLRKQDGPGIEAVVARERAALERAQALEARERELQARVAELEAETERVSARERELASRLDESRSERELAHAERTKLEERAEEARRVEKELAARRIELERERDRGGLEAKLELRERELAHLRQQLDAERNALLDRERALRRREAADVRQSFDEPFVAPSFSEGLAAFVSSRSK